MIDWSEEWTQVLLDLSRLPIKGGGKNHNRNEHLLCAIRTSTADTTSNQKGELSRGNEEALKATTMLQWIGADEDTLRAHGVLNILESNGMPPRVDRESFAEVGGYKYIGMISTRARGRKLFVTAQGHLGLGHMALKEGDAVAVFLGFQVPFLIREVGDGTHQLVGETYLDDFMDGEALEGNPKVAHKVVR